MDTVKNTTTICSALLVSLALVSTSYAQINNDQITACANNAGNLRLSTSGSCAPNERRVTWNVQGPQGPQGPRGPEGPEGPAGVSGYELIFESSVVNMHDVVGEGVGVWCPVGKKVLGGGGHAFILNGGCGSVVPTFDLAASYPDLLGPDHVGPEGRDGWLAFSKMSASVDFSQCYGTAEYRVYAVCASVEP